MAIEHSTIADADRHEAKGASTAIEGQVLKSDGDGTTSFVDPSTLDNIIFTSIISNSNSSAINPSAVDTPLVASFDSTVSNADIVMDSSGVITVNTDGLYQIAFNLNFGRSTSTGTAIVLARLLVNDVPFGFTQGVSLATVNTARPVRIDLFLNLVATDTFKVQIMRDSAGSNDGGLVPIAVTDPSWSDVKSWFVRVAKVLGAS